MAAQPSSDHPAATQAWQTRSPLSAVPLFSVHDPIFDRTRTPEQRRQAVSNLWTSSSGRHRRHHPDALSVVIDQSHKSTLHRYLPVDGVPRRAHPVLLVLPSVRRRSASTLRRGCSLTEHLLQEAGRPTWWTTGEIGLRDPIWDRVLGLRGRPERDQEGLRGCRRQARAPDRLVPGRADRHPDHRRLFRAADQIGRHGRQPFDLSKHPMVAPHPQGRNWYTGGRIIGTVLKMLGGLPSQIVGPAFKATSLTTLPTSKACRHADQAPRRPGVPWPTSRRWTGR